MRICQVRLEGFRGVQQGVVTFPQHCVLLGPNNVGKSTIVESLALLFGRERVVRPVSDWEFFGGVPKPDSRFTIVATVTDFTNDSDTDPANVPEWFLGERSARPVWWDEKSQSLSTAADPPDGTQLAAQVALTGRYDEDSCEFDLVRYFFDGPCDPFTDTCRIIPVGLLKQVGLFLLSSNREWDKLLSFGSSTLLKVLREYEALPGRAIDTLKEQLRTEVVKVEESAPFSDILEAAEKELQAFALIGPSGRLVYRPTSLDALAVLQCLVAHIEGEDSVLVPVSRQGAGTVSLQAFLLLLAFAANRRHAGRNFILAAEEPELHLHPSLHQRLVQRIRGASTQSFTTTQSPNVAAAYQPHEVLFVQNCQGEMTATPLRTVPVRAIGINSVKKLYLVHRTSLYEALMGAVILVPEGSYDHEWLSLWQRVAQAFPEAAESFDLLPTTIVPTSDGAVVETYAEIARFRPDAIPILDGDKPGADYLDLLAKKSAAPSKVVRLGQNASAECLAAWMLEPALNNPGPALARLLPTGQRTLKDLQTALSQSQNKKDRELHETLAWEALDNTRCCERACEFFNDLSAIATGGPRRNPSWNVSTTPGGMQCFRAEHVSRG